MCRYELSEEKTFASLFHPDKEAILRLVDHFVKKEGKVRRCFLPVPALDAVGTVFAEGYEGWIGGGHEFLNSIVATPSLCCERARV